MNNRLTAKQLRELLDFHKTDRANQPHMRPTGRIITDPEEMAKVEPPGIVSKAYVVRGKRRQDRDSDHQDESEAKQ